MGPFFIGDFFLSHYEYFIILNSTKDNNFYRTRTGVLTFIWIGLNYWIFNGSVPGFKNR